jgi:hypothetical protein
MLMKIKDKIFNAPFEENCDLALNLPYAAA